ncbi:hypothetical protein [Clostridium sp.]|uniref:hypothetical protein n=1 Tax=Clostridium sp. TaxID=1506 RepID=UPI00262ABA42|nr:hypothetical protein [Clostridium sp.]
MRKRVKDSSNSMVAALGIKTLNQNLKNALKSVIKCDPEFIILSTRNFLLSDDLWNDLKNANCPKLIILPFDYRYRNQKNAVNDVKIINSLINDGNIGTILNSTNESNCVLTDKFCYVSSGALNYNGITNYIEIYEIMNCNDSNYELWRSEIFNFANREIENYRRSKNREGVESKLNESIARAVKLFSDMTRQLTKSFINEVLEVIEDIDRAIILSVDAYQYIDKNFIDLIKFAKKVLSKITCIIDDLTRLILNFNKNKEITNIKMFNCIREGFWCLLPLIDEFKELENVIFFNTSEQWRNPDEGIIDFLSNNTNPNNELIKTFYEGVIFQSKECFSNSEDNE